MSELIHDLIFRSAQMRPGAPAITHKGDTLSYSELARRVGDAAYGFVDFGLARAARVAIYMDKRPETVIAMFGAAAAGGVYVPVNALLRGKQVGHILRDCEVRILVTTRDRFENIRDELSHCGDLQRVIIVGDSGETAPLAGIHLDAWDHLLASGAAAPQGPHRVIDSDMGAILYTSGSTGMPKGVVLSHRNLVVGAVSVSQYLENTPDDRILSVLPLSFDAGMSQLTTAFNVGASVVLMNYLLPQDVIKMVARGACTGLAGVPPLWSQLAQLPWPEEAVRRLRYITNTGGHMPRTTLDRLRAALPGTQPFLMYGLTEAFRSTYLPPDEVDRRPDSIGKAIPNAEILVVGEDGALCKPGEEGELVHRGPLVSLGYWNDPERTAQRFRPAPNQPSGVCVPELAVWSGDTVRMDDEGFLYFVGRKDEMIKTSGYRVSPTEIEEVVYASGGVGEAAALGIPHADLGQVIVVVATPPEGGGLDAEAVLDFCRG